MEVILMEDVDKLGRQGDIVKVAEGYARNYLLGKGKAQKVNKNSLNQLEALKKRREKALLQEKQEKQELADKIEQVSCTFEVEVGEEDKLFGSITSQDIAKSLKAEGIEMDKRKIVLEEPIKKVGVYHVAIKLHPEVTANLKIWIVKK